jgi:hypothetical protein
MAEYDPHQTDGARLVRARVRGAASAQGTTGSISGFVTDDTGGALPGATVPSVTRDRPERALVTDGAGRYRAAARARQYEVTVELQGFRPARDRLTLTVGQTPA